MAFSCRLIGFDKGLNEYVYRVFFLNGSEQVLSESEVAKLRSSACQTKDEL